MVKKFLSKKNIYLLLIFVLLCILFYFIPLTGDDWQNYGNGKFGFINILRNSYRYYLNWEGRIGSRILIFSVTYNKWLWNVMASLSVIFMIYFSSKLINYKQKNITLLFTSLLLLINYDMFVQCFFWIAGHITYTVCIVFFLFYMYYIFNKLEKNKYFTNIEKILLFFLVIAMCTFVENIAVGILVFNLLMFIYSYFIKKTKENYYIVVLVASIVGLLIQVLSPGTAMRISIEMGEFGNLNLFQKIIYNLSNFVEFGYLINPMMVLIMVVAFDLLVYKNEKNIKKRLLLIIFMSVVPILTIIGNINLISPFEFGVLNKISSFLSFISNSKSSFIIIYWICFDLVYLISIFIYLKSDINKLKIVIVYLVSQACILAMLVTPTWSNRVAFATVIFNYIVSLLVFNVLNIGYNKIFKKVICSFCIGYFSLLLVLYFNVYSCVKYRDSYILEKYSEGSRVINYYKVPDRLLWSQYPYSNSYRNAFNVNLGLKEDIQYIEKNAKWKYKIFFNR